VGLYDADLRKRGPSELRTAQLRTYEAAMAAWDEFGKLVLDLSAAVQRRSQEFDSLDTITLLKMAQQSAGPLAAVQRIERESYTVLWEGCAAEVGYRLNPVPIRRARTPLQKLLKTLRDMGRRRDRRFFWKG
jgi:hypothetical protein